MLKNSLSFACQGFPVLLIASEGNKINTMSGKSKEKELLEFSHLHFFASLYKSGTLNNQIQNKCKQAFS